MSECDSKSVQECYYICGQECANCGTFRKRKYEQNALNALAKKCELEYKVENGELVAYKTNQYAHHVKTLQDLIDQRKALRPVEVKQLGGKVRAGKCGACGAYVESEYHHYCRICGTRIDWSV